MRHGDARYCQQKVSIEDASDLLPEGRIRISRAIDTYAELIGPGTSVRLVASPYGRTIESAKIAADLLNARGCPCSPIEIEPEAEELRNYDDEVLRLLVQGGRYEQHGERVELDAARTNPAGLEYSAYFVQAAYRRLPHEVISGFPPDFRRRLWSFETFQQAAERILCLLKRLFENESAYTTVLVLTHGGCVSFPITEYTSGRRLEVDPGGFVCVSAAGHDFQAETAYAVVPGEEAATSIVSAPVPLLAAYERRFAQTIYCAG